MSRLDKLRAALPPLLLLLAVTPWLAGLPGPFQFDDFVTPLGDPASQSLAAWRDHRGVTLRPFTKLTYALEAELGLGEVPPARRAVSLAIHLAAGAVLLGLLRSLMPALHPAAALVLTLLWVVHPVHAESVLAVSGRSAALSGLCLLASLLAMARGRPVWAALAFGLAVLARETALAGLLPLALVAWSRSEDAGARERLARLAPALGVAVAGAAWMASTPRYRELAEYSFLGRPLLPSMAAQLAALPAGLVRLVDPRSLSIDYGVSLPANLLAPGVALGLAAFAAAALGALRLRRAAPVAAVGLALWLAALLPTQSVVPKLDPLTNRPLALAWAGLLLAAAPLVGAALARDAASRRRWRAPVAACLGAAALAGLAASTQERAALYRSELALWADAAAKSQTNPRPHLQLALLLEAAGRRQEAREALRRAREIDPFSSRIAALWVDQQRQSTSE
jgi:protein O-mannosyl-transferase